MLGQSSLRQKEHPSCLRAIPGENSILLPANNETFAYSNFQTDEEAAKANALLHGTRIFGRPCRIKNARAPRKFLSLSARHLTDSIQVLSSCHVVTRLIYSSLRQNTTSNSMARSSISGLHLTLREPCTTCLLEPSCVLNSSSLARSL
jgi:hypothetical protein